MGGAPGPKILRIRKGFNLVRVRASSQFLTFDVWCFRRVFIGYPSLIHVLMKVLEKTVSIDEKAYYEKGELKPVPAEYVLDEETGIVYLRKANGTIERIGTKAYWDRIKKFPAELETRVEEPVQKFTGFCQSCGLCDTHKNTTALLNIVVTNMCNLRCWYCFFYSEIAGYVYYPSLEDIKKMFELAKKVNGYMPPVQITGGEPTLRDDLADIIKIARDLGSPHVQLNTNSVKPGILYYENPEEAAKWVKTWKDAGLNTIYTSFDGVDPKINFKNHYEIPFALRAYYDGGVRSIVLVPTVFQGNLKEVPRILAFAIRNYKWGIKGVNYQPISLVGMVKKGEREKLRTTQSDVVEALAPFKLDNFDYWYPISAVQFLADLMTPVEKNVHFYNNEKCGLATYVVVDEENQTVYPITKYIDVDAFLKEVEELYKSWLKKLKLGINLIIQRYVFGKSEREYIIEKLDDYIKKRKLPNGLDLKEVIAEAIETGNYDALAKFHEGTLFIGMMHFMDPYNYDTARVQRCDIHYAAPTGVYPFCTYNVWAEKYRDALLKAFKVKDKEKEKAFMDFEKAEAQKVVEFRKKIDEIVENPIYRESYEGL